RDWSSDVCSSDLCSFKMIILGIDIVSEGAVPEGKSWPVVGVFAGFVLVPASATCLPNSAFNLCLNSIVKFAHARCFNVNKACFSFVCSTNAAQHVFKLAF